MRALRLTSSRLAAGLLFFSDQGWLLFLKYSALHNYYLENTHIYTIHFYNRDFLHVILLFRVFCFLLLKIFFSHLCILIVVVPLLLPACPPIQPHPPSVPPQQTNRLLRDK